MQYLIRETQVVLLIFVSLISISQCAPKSNDSKIEEEIKLFNSIAEIDACMIKSVYSFIYEDSYLPKTLAESNNRNCPKQIQGFKCLKEKSRTLPAILKRGVQTFLTARQKFHKKYCAANANVELQTKFINASKCIVERKFDKYVKLETIFANTQLAIRDRNFNDSSTELKYICCNILTYRKGYIDLVEPECGSENKAYIEELISSIIPNDLGLLCDDDNEKYTKKVCPTLEKLPIADKFDAKAKSNSPSVVTLYLVATLGEPRLSVQVGRLQDK